LVADIYFNEALPPTMMRIVCCKEMLHFFDGDTERTYTEDQVSSLIRDWASESTVNELLEKIGGEIANQIWALVVLAPLHLVEKYRADYESGRIPDAEIAAKFEIPEFLVRLLYSSEFKLLAEMHLR